MQEKNYMPNSTGAMYLWDTAVSNYWIHLREKTQCFVDSIKKPPDLSQEDIDEIVQYLISPGINMTSYTVNEATKFRQEPLVTERDKTILCLLFCKKNLCQGKEKVFYINNLPDGVGNLFDNALRSNEKNIGKFLKERPKYPVSKIVSDEFCADAKLLLTFKHIGLRADAGKKKHALNWLGIITDPPCQFKLEDYWYYEQQTGVNLAVEIAALIDKAFEEYKYDLLCDENNQNIITEILCDCIADNYGYIACVPAIDWKINVMRMACGAIIYTMIDMLHSEDGHQLLGLDLIKLSKEVFAIKQKEMRLCKKSKPLANDAEIQMDFSDKLMKKLLSNVFNQLLSLFVIDALWLDLFDSDAKLSDFQKWLRTNHDAVAVNSKRPELVEAFKHTPIYLGQYSLKVTAQIGEDNNEVQLTSDCIAELKSLASYYEKAAMDKLKLRPKKSALIFCNQSDFFVKEYCNIVDKYIKNLDMCEQKEKLESEQLRNLGMARGKKAERFILIHKAIDTAIKTSE